MGVRREGRGPAREAELLHDLPPHGLEEGPPAPLASGPAARGCFPGVGSHVDDNTWKPPAFFRTSAALPAGSMLAPAGGPGLPPSGLAQAPRTSPVTLSPHPTPQAAPLGRFGWHGCCRPPGTRPSQALPMPSAPAQASQAWGPRTCLPGTCPNTGSGSAALVKASALPAFFRRLRACAPRTAAQARARTHLHVVSPVFLRQALLQEQTGRDSCQAAPEAEQGPGGSFP